MKTFNEIKKNVLEDYNAWGSTNRSALSDFGTHRVEFDEQVFAVFGVVFDNVVIFVVVGFVVVGLVVVIGFGVVVVI